MAAVRGVRAQPVGREPELALLREFLERGDGARALVLLGGPGIGKTTLWEAGIDAARQRDLRVLSTRASGAPARLAFAALIDLLDEVGGEELEPLPAPQRRALEVAVLRADPIGPPPELRAIALGLLNVLRGLADRQSLLIAIDDVQWLDSHSLDVLTFVAPRLESPAVRFLLSKRVGRASPLERAIGPPLERLDVGPLSLGATRQLLRDRLGLSLPRPLLRRLVDSTTGNPLFALEVGRTFTEGDLPGLGDDLPVPDAVEDLLGTRVTRLTAPVRRLLLAVALNADLRPAQLAALADSDALDEAVSAGVLALDGERVRAAHPLLAAAATKHSRAGDRRELHRALAGVVDDGELRARHLAGAADAPDEALAATVSAAARAASARGARREAIELGEQALRVTPPDSPARGVRVLALASYLETAGETPRLTDFVRSELPSLPAGSLRARAWLILSEGAHIRSVADFRWHLEQALVEANDDPTLRARVVAKMSSAVIAVERIGEAEAQLLEVLPVARRADPDVERVCLYALAWARGLAGRPLADLCERFAEASEAVGHLAESPERIAGQRHVWRGELERAHAMFSRRLAQTDERGEVGSYAWWRLHSCELELRRGDCEAAARLLDEWASDQEFFVTPTYERCRALLAVERGLRDEAERWVGEAIARAEAVGMQWDWLEGLRARGLWALLDHDPARAAESLRTVWQHCEREGVAEPGVFPVAPDLVEALAELGELDEARAVTNRLQELSEQQEHPWGLATAKRCEGIIELATGYADAAVEALEEAAAEYDRLGLRFDAARSLLALGRAQRRHRKWGAARRTLEEADALFADMGSPGWVDETRAELARVGARRPQPSGELTPAERRVAELAVDGLANKEIAQTLFVSIKTVEGHLSHVYAKLGVRSRAQLARRLSGAA